MYVSFCPSSVKVAGNPSDKPVPIGKKSRNQALVYKNTIINARLQIEFQRKIT